MKSYPVFVLVSLTRSTHGEPSIPPSMIPSPTLEPSSTPIPTTHGPIAVEQPTPYPIDATSEPSYSPEPLYFPTYVPIGATPNPTSLPENPTPTPMDALTMTPSISSTYSPSRSPSISPVELPTVFPSTSPSHSPTTTSAPTKECKDDWIYIYRQLTWSDFKGKVPEKPKNDAETATGLSYDFSTAMAQNGKDKWKATFSSLEGTISLDRCESWVKPDAKSEDLLKHEQGHYDISECWAREFNKALQALKNKLMGSGNSSQAAEADLLKQTDKILKAFQKENEKMQKEYDSKGETDHGKKQGKQNEWNTKIENWLKNGFDSNVNIPIVE